MFKIVFVDDEAITLKLLSCVLDWEELGITIAGTASDGKEALELCRRVSPDIIIADIRMPGMTGVMLSEMIRKSDSDVKIIFLSAYAEFEYAQSAIENKVSGYLLKPLDEEKLEALIRKVVAELKQEKAEKNDTKKFRTGLIEAEIRENYLKKMRGESVEEWENRSPHTARVFCVRLYCPEYKDYLTGTEEMIKDTLPQISQEELLSVQINNYEVFLLSDSKEITSDRILASFEKAGLPGICGTADCEESLLQTMSRAKKAADSTFFSGKNIAVWKADTAADAPAPGAGDYESSIRMLIETADSSALRDQIFALTDEYEKTQTDPVRLTGAIYDILILLKTALVRAYPDTDLAASSLRHIDQPRLMACQNSEKLRRFLERLLRDLEKEIGAQLQDSGDSSVIRRARYFAAQHCGEIDFSLQDAADYVGLSRNHFSKVFHDGTGIKFWDYVTQMRIRNARRLLTETDLPIAAIAERAGYETETHFNRKFKQLEGITPGKYRKKYGK
ncbi:MAG: response regulator [Blautia sp.]|nr:response regulator [Blautia sp.]